MNKGLLVASMLLASNVAMASTNYTIGFEEDDLIRPGGSEGNWGQVIDDEYINGTFGGNDGGFFGDIDVRFWTSVETDVNFNNVSFTDPNFVDNPTWESSDGTKSRAPYLVLFNTGYTDTDDNDLEVGVDNGDGMASNYPGEDSTIAIINEDWDDGDYYEICKEKGTENELACKDPDDRYKSGSSPHGGWVFIEFSEPVNLHTINLVDIENGGNQLGEIGYYGDTNNLLGSESMLPTYDNTTKTNGNGGWVTQTLNSVYEVTTLVLRMQGSGGFDNIVFSAANVTEVAEPSTIAMFGLATIGLLGLRRRRR